MHRSASLVLVAASSLWLSAVASCGSTGSPGAPGSIRVVSLPAGAAIFLDGTGTGLRTDATLGDVGSGSHLVRVTLPGYDDGSRSVTVEPGAEAEVTFALTPARTGSAGTPYDIGTPVLGDVWVSPTGDDGNDGTTRDAPLQTISAAWARIPTGTPAGSGTRIRLLPGNYPCEGDCINYFADRTGTQDFPIVLQAADGPGTATIRGGLNLANVSHLYLLDLTLVAGAGFPTYGNNVLHCESCDHLLVRACTLVGPDPATLPDNYDIQEVIKVNQSQYVYVEDSDVSGAYQTIIDTFSLQHGHFLDNRIHGSGEWCMYVKGGSAYLRVEGNELFDCALGFQAGEGSNFEVMRAPWVHYESYDVKLVNNVLHDIRGVPLSVAGSFNVLFAYNTLYRVAGRADPAFSLLQLVHGSRVCYDTSENGVDNAAELCGAMRTAGGWCPNAVGMETGGEWIPSRHVLVFNNVFLNPAGVESAGPHLNVRAAVTPPSGSNIPNPAATDDDVRIEGNVLWNGGPGHPLGLDDSTGCAPSNPTCNETAIRAANRINELEPALADPEGGDYRPATGGALESLAAAAVPDFTWTDAPASPAVPAGDTSNAVTVNRDGEARTGSGRPGAY